MYVGKQYTATRSAKKEYKFQCTHCEHSQDFHVFGIGTAEGNSAYFTDNKGAALRADQGAARNAATDALKLAKLVMCPQCSQRNTQALRKHWLLLSLQSVLACVLVIPLFYFRTESTSFLSFLPWAACISVVLIVGAIVVGVSRINDSDRRVGWNSKT